MKDLSQLQKLSALVYDMAFIRDVAKVKQVKNTSPPAGKCHVFLSELQDSLEYLPSLCVSQQFFFLFFPPLTG